MAKATQPGVGINAPVSPDRKILDFEAEALVGTMLIRRDVKVEDWSNPREDNYGLRATTRFGLGILRSNAVAKMTNIKTTL